MTKEEMREAAFKRCSDRVKWLRRTQRLVEDIDVQVKSNEEPSMFNPEMQGLEAAFKAAYAQAFAAVIDDLEEAERCD